MIDNLYFLFLIIASLRFAAPAGETAGSGAGLPLVDQAPPRSESTLRFDNERAMLESDAVLSAIGKIIDRSGYEKPFEQRAECGVQVTSSEDGGFSTTEILTDNLLGSVTMPFVKDGDRVLAVDNRPLITDIHSHPGAGSTAGRDTRKYYHPSLASEPDKRHARALNRPIYIVNGTWSLLRYDPATDRTTVVFARGEYRRYLERARRVAAGLP